jgi:two-component system NtrC family sensor kinase
MNSLRRIVVGRAGNMVVARGLLSKTRERAGRTRPWRQMFISKDTSIPLSRRFRLPVAVMVLAAIAVAPMIITGAITLQQFRRAYRARVHDQLRETVQRHTATIDAFVSDRLSDIRVVARQQPRQRLEDPEYLRQLLNVLREEYHGAFVDLGLVTSDGLQIAYAGPFNLTMADYSSAEWFKLARDREHFISDVFAGLRGTPHFIVTASNHTGDERYIVRATIDFEAFNELVSNLRIGTSGFAFIFNLEGRFQTEPRFEVTLDGSPYSDLLDGRISRERVSIVEGHDLFGRPTIFALAPLRQGQWILSYQQRLRDAFEDLYTLQTLSLAVFLVAAVAAVLVSYLIASQIGARLSEADRKQTIMSDKVIETGRLASIGELAAGIAHEINNPVAIMVEEAGWIEDLLGDSDQPSDDAAQEIARAVQQIRTQGERCKEITHKLLSFARKTDPTARPLDVNELVEDVVGLLGQKTRYANVKVERRLEQGLPPVYASPSELQQVLLNLVNNAVDAIGHEGGTVSVDTALDSDGFVVLTVADTGSGIPAANLERIFDPFFTTKPVGQGTGLGLSICYGIVDKLGGRIGVESEVGAGTTFTIHLPADKPDSLAVSDGDPRRPARSGDSQ